MPTECSASEMDFGRAGGRRVVADFDGGLVSSDAGALLLAETDKAIGLIDRFAGCFHDRRNPLYTVHQLKAGDVVVIPAGTGHWFTKIDDHINYLMVRIDPDKVTPLRDEDKSKDYLSKPVMK